MRKGLGLESGGLPLWRPPLPLNGLGRGTVPEAGTREGRQEKGTEEVEEQTGSGKCCSKLFSWLRSRPDTLGVTINRDTPPQRAGRGGQLLPTEVPMFEGVGSTTKEERTSVSILSCSAQCSTVSSKSERCNGERRQTPKSKFRSKNTLKTKSTYQTYWQSGLV